RRFDQNRIGNQQRAGDDEWREGIGQHLAHEDRHVALPDDDSSLHELARFYGHHLAAHDAGDGRQLTVAMAMMRLSAEGARMATSTMAKMKEGMVWKNSLTRMSTSSMMPA